MSLDLPNSASPRSPGSAGQKSGRPSIPSPIGGKNSTKKESHKEISRDNSENQEYANPPTGVRNVNLVAACGDVTTSLAAATSSYGAARVLGNWANYTEDQGPGEDDNFTVVKSKKRCRDSPGSPTAATPSSGTRSAGATRRPRSSTGWAPRAEEVRTTRAHIAEARARQASSTEDHCVYVERSPELEPYHYMRAIDRMFGSTREVFQVTKINGHFLVGLANRGMAERLINEGLEVEGTLHRAFPFRKRAERITVGNLPFFVGDAAVISALSSFGRVTSIAPKLMKAGPYIYNDGRREAFIILREGMTIERLPTRLDITIKGEAWPAYLSSGIRCSRCRGQGHRRANCPLLARRTTAPGPATPTSPTSVPPATAPRLPQQPSAQPPPPASPSPTMEVSDVPPTSRAALHPPAALRQSPPAPSALPAEDAPLAPPPVTPAPSLRTPGSREPAAPTPDVEMSIAEETSASSTSSLKNATRVDLDAFIEKHPSVSFAGTDALGLGREECVALAGLIGQILDLRPGAASNLYKVLGQVKAELRTTPAAVPTPPPPAPRPAETTSPALHGERTSPDIATPPPPLSCQFIDDRWTEAEGILHELNQERDWGVGISESDITEAVIYPEDREPLIRRLSTRRRSLLAGFISAAIERARDSDPFVLSVPNLILAKCPEGAESVPERPSPKLQAGEDKSPKIGFKNKNFERIQENPKYAKLSAGKLHANPAAARGVTAPTIATCADPDPRTWAETMEVVDGPNDGFTVFRHKRRRRGSASSEHATRQPNKPKEPNSSQQRKRPTGSRAVPPQEVKATRANIADARARQSTSNQDNYIFIEHCPELSPYEYLQAIDKLVGGPRNIIQFNRMNGHVIVGLSSKDLASRLVEQGLDIEGTTLKVFPYRKRAERIVVANLPGFVEDTAVVDALRPYGKVTSIAPIQIKMGEYSFTDGRREAYILLHEGKKLDNLPTRLDIRSKGESLPAFLSFGIKCSKCGKQGHRRANCPMLARRTTGPAEPAPPAQPALVAPPAPLPAPETLEPGTAPLDIVMTEEEENTTSSTASQKVSAYSQLEKFLEKPSSPSFAKTKQLDLAREEVLRILSSRTQQKRRIPSLTAAQAGALSKLLNAILAIHPGTDTTVYKLLRRAKGQLDLRLK
ncbi:hypothetical protein LAZ67_18000359 [Cordylochernes scorpioides]|uniref:CCHC-type domain-containing protein n=1 Tax=Cordylochernes scorpioides TaxID=51811 RepID=A0ABY6LFS0_9ARAC|nr:hypothetical protein LAZ67_18000359 [Cordylochernes scorpioides]